MLSVGDAEGQEHHHSNRQQREVLAAAQKRTTGGSGVVTGAARALAVLRAQQRLGFVRKEYSPNQVK